MQYRLVDIKTNYRKEAANGGVSIIEGDRDIPFDIKRIYYIHSVLAGETRGFHAHKALRQLLFCPYGSIRINLDDGHKVESVVLDDPSKGLVLQPGLWRTMDWLVSNSVLCVAASEYYSEDDYIREYSDFIAYIKEMEKDNCGS